MLVTPATAASVAVARPRCAATGTPRARASCTTAAIIDEDNRV